MLNQEQKDKLAPEQLVTAERWEREKESRALILNEMVNGGDVKSCLWRMVEVTASHCEHDRSTLSTCMACEEIEELLYGNDEDD